MLALNFQGVHWLSAACPICMVACQTPRVHEHLQLGVRLQPRQLCPQLTRRHRFASGHVEAAAGLWPVVCSSSAAAGPWVILPVLLGLLRVFKHLWHCQGISHCCKAVKNGSRCWTPVRITLKACLDDHPCFPRQPTAVAVRGA